MNRLIFRAPELRGTSRSRTRVGALALAIAIAGTTVIAVSSPATLPVAQADETTGPQQGAPDANAIQALLDAPIPADVDSLLAHVSKVSHAAAGVNDEVQRIQLELEETKKNIDAANVSVDKANGNAASLTTAMEQSKGRVKEVSAALYNGATASELSAIVKASSPNDAVERSAYLATIADRNDVAVKAAEKDLQAISDARNDAALARAKAQFQEQKLVVQQSRLQQRSDQLEQLKSAVMDAVDNLSPEDRQRWVDQNGPIDVDVNEFLARPELAGLSSNPEVAKYAQGVVAAALSKLGSPYSWGAAGPDSFDCSGLMLWAYKQNGQDIPRTSQAQMSGGVSVSRDAIQPGDIVAYYPGATHVGMYIGDGKIVHASDYGIPVQVVPVDSMPIVGISRY